MIWGFEDGEGLSKYDPKGITIKEWFNYVNSLNYCKEANEKLCKHTGSIYATQHKEVLQISRKNGPMDKVHKPEIH